MISPTSVVVVVLPFVPKAELDLAHDSRAVLFQRQHKRYIHRHAGAEHNGLGRLQHIRRELSRDADRPAFRRELRPHLLRSQLVAAVIQDYLLPHVL